MRSAAFTLIELLVVIAIIAVLSSVVLASLNSAREKGRLGGARYFSAQVDHVAGDYAVALYDLEEGPTGTTAADRSGNNNNGNLSGGPTWTTDTSGGNSAYSLFFNGVHQSVNSSNNLGISGSMEFTMCAWIKGSAPWKASDASFMGNNGGGVVGAGQALYFSIANGYPTLNFKVNFFKADNAISANVWHFVCGVRTSGATISATTKLYVDGSQVTGTVGGTDLFSASIIDYPANIGGDFAGSASTFGGWIDNVHFFAKSLTAKEIGKLYASEAPRFKLADDVK